MPGACRVQYEQWISTCGGERSPPSARSSPKSQQGDREPTVNSGNSNNTIPPAASPSSSRPSHPPSVSQGRDAAPAEMESGSSCTPSSLSSSSKSPSANRVGDPAPAGARSSPKQTPLIPAPLPQPPLIDETGQGRPSCEQARTRYILWCVNSARSQTVVKRICVAIDDKDKQVFSNLRRVYNETRGWWRAMASLYTLTEIRYVKV